MKFATAKLGVILCYAALFLSPLLASESKILLICGPSGVGKSTVIQDLKVLDSRFKYITPYTTRPLREGETDKKHMSYKQMLELEASGDLIALNQVHGNYYATPKWLIEEAFCENKFPVLDWPIEKVPLMDEKLGGRIAVVYLYPSDLSQLKQQLSKDGRDQDGRRFTAGREELIDFFLGRYDELVDFKIKSVQDQTDDVAREIYCFYLQSIDLMHSTNQKIAGLFSFSYTSRQPSL